MPRSRTEEADQARIAEQHLAPRIFLLRIILRDLSLMGQKGKMKDKAAGRQDHVEDLCEVLTHTSRVSTR
jgi:hypothetical protein